MFQAYLLKQNWNQSLPKYWNDNNPFKTHFLNALSITLPECEKFFIETIISYSKDLTDPAQIKEIKEFVKQESHHRHVHNQYNNWLKEQGLPVDRLQQLSLDKWNFVRRNLNNRNKLAITICVEHITVVYASVLLRYSSILDNMHPQFNHTWRWHAIEEIEHKSVAMNVWNSQGYSNVHKNLAMILVLPVYIWYVGKNTIIFLNKDKELWKYQTLKDMTSFLFNRETGLIRKSFIPWISFLSFDFHPDKYDDRDILSSYNKII